MKVLPNSTGVAGPENEMARPLPQRTDVLGVPISDAGAGLEPAGVTGRLCGRFARWMLCLGGPKLGLRGAERSMLFVQAMDIFALQVSETEILARTEIDMISAVEPFPKAIVVEGIKDGASRLCAGCSLYNKVMTSRGRHDIGS